MNAQAALAELGVTSTDNEAVYRLPSEQSTDFIGREVEFATNFLAARRSPANDGDIDTSSGSFRMPSTFTRLMPGKRLAPAELLAEWSGCVTSIQEDGFYFSATLSGVEGQGVKNEEEDAIIPITDVSEWDKDLLSPGNFFRLCVMYEVSSSGQPRRYTQVVFRRLPAYRQQDLDEALERGRKLARGLRVE